jgi:hypothetical protein
MATALLLIKKEINEVARGRKEHHRARNGFTLMPLLCLMCLEI